MSYAMLPKLWRTPRVQQFQDQKPGELHALALVVDGSLVAFRPRADWHFWVVSLPAIPAHQAAQKHSVRVIQLASSLL